MIAIPKHRLAVCAGLVLFASAATAHAQWTDDPSINTPVVVSSGDQTQVKLAPLADGSTYVSWFSATGSGYDVYLQRLNADGERMWGDGGVLIADRSFSSTQDYGLSADGDGYAWLAFRDDRFGDVQITVARVSPSGDLVFGKGGVQVTNDSAFKAAPQVAAIEADSAVVGWTHDSETRLARVDDTGSVLWTNTVALPTNSTALSGVHSNGDGTAIALVINQGLPFVPRHMYALKVDSDGNSMWGDDPVVIFNNGSLQFGNFPKGIATSEGGLVVAWYQSSPALQCYVQRLDGDGAALLPAGGLDVSTNAAQLRTAPDAAFNETTGDIYVFWRETDANQGLSGVYGQRVMPNGTRAWGASGLAVVGLGGGDRTQVRAAVLEGDAIVAFNDSAGFNLDVIRAGRFDPDGNAQWSPLVIAADSASGKSRLQTITSAEDTVILAWADNRDSTNDIYAQQITADGSLGHAETGTPGDLNDDGAVDGLDLLILLSAWGKCDEPADCPADLNNDGAVDGLDLLILLSNWG